MIKNCRVILILILICLFLNPSAVKASPGSEYLKVILIVDNSGSMETSDPGGLRFTGVRLFASLLDPGDSLGLILFATESKVITNGIVTLDSQDGGSSLLASFQPPAADGFTNIKAALKDAGNLLEQADLSRGKVVIVLLTDGKPEIPNPYPMYEKETLALARSLNVPIMAIALTSAAQTPFLDHLAVVTNGTVVPANDASDLLEAYLRVLGQIKDRTIIGGEKLIRDGSITIEPALAPYIDSATFVISKPAPVKTYLLDSNGQEVIGDQSKDGHYSIFTLERPSGGRYSFHLQGGGEAQAWAILRSRLRVHIVSPSAFHPLHHDMPIVLNLVEETPTGDFIKIIGDANFTASITAPDGNTVSLDRFYDNGTHGDAVAGDGNYTRLFPSPKLEGIYPILIQGWKGVVPVQVESRVTVKKFPEFVVDAPSQNIEVRGTSFELRVHLNTVTSFDQGKVVAQITTPSGQVDEIFLQGHGTYRAEYLPVEEGTYHVTFETRNVKYLGVDYQTSIERIFEVSIIPFVNVAVNKIEIPAACLSAPHEVLLTLSILSSDDENLQFSTPAGWNISPESVKVKKGKQDLQLRLQVVDGLNEATHRVEMQITGGDRLEVQPEPMIGVNIQFPDLYTRCRTPMHFGIVILFTAFFGVVVIQRLRRAALPPKTCGTLRYWEIGKDALSAMEIDLTEFGKSVLTIGNGATCGLMIPYAGLESEHARLLARKSTDGADMYLEPIAEVRKGYNRQNVKFILRHGDTFRMGTHEFQYLSDHGE